MKITENRMLLTTIRKTRNHCQDVDHCRDEDHCQYHLGIDHCQDGNCCQDIDPVGKEMSVCSSLPCIIAVTLPIFSSPFQGSSSS